MRFVLNVYFLFALLSQIQAGVKHLTIPGEHWHTPSAWSPIGVPTANDSVIIGGEVYVEPDSTALAMHVTVLEQGWLVLERDLILNRPGRLLIENSPGDAIYNQGLIDNGGRITINQAGNRGIYNDAGTINILDRAILELDFTFDFFASAILSSGKITNGGRINIDDYNYNNRCIENIDSFVNLATGTITINRCHEVIRNTDSGVFENYGMITASTLSDGIFNSAKFTNMDTIILDSIKATVIANIMLYNSDTLLNSASGRILIKKGNAVSDAIYNSGYLANQGSLTISDVGLTACLNYEEWINQGTLTVQRCQQALVNQSQSTFTNTGTVTTSDISGDPITIELSSTFDSDGELVINH